MQAILILVVIGVVIFLIYRASPGVRLQKADGLAAAKNWDAAISIYEKYFARNPDIPARIAKTLISMAEHAKDPKPFYQQVLNLRSRISGSVTTAYTQHESKAGLALATLHYEAIQKQKGLEERLRLLRENVSYIGTLHQDEAQSELSAFLAKHNYEIAKALYSLGQIAERAGSFQKARTFYSEVSNGDKKLMANILLRIQICNAKQALPVEQLVKRVVAGADLAIQNDYLYRLAVSLVKTKNFSRAETVVGLLQSNGEKNVGPLEEALQSERNKTLLTAVNAVNLDIEKIHGKGLTNKELEGLYQRINKLAAIGTGEDQNLRKQVHALRPAIFNRLLAAYREEKPTPKHLIYVLPGRRFT